MWLPVVALALSATLAELPPAGRNASGAGARRRAQSRHRVPMNGACAVVARSNTWTKDPSDKEVDPETGELHEIGGDAALSSATFLRACASSSDSPAVKAAVWP